MGWEEVSEITVDDYLKCISEMKKAHPFLGDAKMYVTRSNPENYPHVVVVLNVDGTEITLERKVTLNL